DSSAPSLARRIGDRKTDTARLPRFAGAGNHRRSSRLALSISRRASGTSRLPAFLTSLWWWADEYHGSERLPFRYDDRNDTENFAGHKSERQNIRRRHDEHVRRA